MTKMQRLVIAVVLLVLAVAVIRVVGDNLGQPSSPTSQPDQPVAQRLLPTSPIESITDQAETGTVGVFIEPDDGRKPVLDELDHAQHSITLEVYLLSDRQIINALKQAHVRGVKVQVMLEEHPFGGAGNTQDVYRELQQAGVDIKWSDPTFRFTHIKTFVIDNQTAIIMSLNLTKSAFTHNRELGVITTVPADVRQAAAIFTADWNRTGEPPGGPLVVSPTNSRALLLGLINGARQSIDIYAEEMQDQQVIADLIAAEERGVAVRLIMSAASGNDTNAPGRAQLEQAGVEVRINRGDYVHAKMMLIDGQRAFIGSENFSATSLDFNRELGIIVTQPANIQRISAVFNRDFANGRSEG